MRSYTYVIMAVKGRRCAHVDDAAHNGVGWGGVGRGGAACCCSGATVFYARIAAA